VTGEDQPADPVMARITAAIERSRVGDPAAARADFTAILHDLGPDADPFHLCTLAHYAAGTSPRPRHGCPPCPKTVTALPCGPGSTAWPRCSIKQGQPQVDAVQIVNL